MYARPIINGELTTLGVSGKLWRDALIMYDRATGSLWSQILGESVAGPAKGNKLRELPSQLTTWGDWLERHPDTLMLERPRISSSTYEQYHYDRRRIGVRDTRNPDKRLGGKTLVFGIERDGSYAAVPMPLLQKIPVVNAEAFKAPIVVVSQPKQVAAFAYERTVDGQILSFEAAGGDGLVLRDRETGSTWDWERGLATDGELVGKELERIEGTVVYWGIWIQYHQDSAIVEGR